MLAVPESLWFEIAIVSIVFAIGNMLFGHFEEQTPKARRVGKYILMVVVILVISNYAGRTIAMSVFGSLLIPVLYIHMFYLPKRKGINGWTGEPKGKYYEFRGWDKNIFDK